MKEFGSLDGVLFNRRTKRLFGGHQRQKSFPESAVEITERYDSPTNIGTVAIGFINIEGERYPYREVDWPETKEKAANIAANKGAGEWDFPELSEWMLELDHQNFNLDLTMFDATERENIIVPVEKIPPEGDPDHIPTVPAEPTTKLGDIWQLGEHRLMCGDSTSIDAVEKLMNGEKAELLFTDPPYSQGVNPSGFLKDRPSFKKLAETEDLNNFNPSDFLGVVSTLNPDSFYIHCNKELILNYIQYARDNGRLWDLLAICKANPIPSKGNKFLSDIEWIVFSRISGVHFDDSHEYDWYRKAQKVNTKASEFGHPTEKWVGLVEQYLKISSKPHGDVLDLFGGSGTTLIACEKTNRKCFVMEVDPNYCDVIIARWEKYTGQKAKLITPSSGTAEETHATHSA